VVPFSEGEGDAGFDFPDAYVLLVGFAVGSGSVDCEFVVGGLVAVLASVGKPQAGFEGGAVDGGGCVRDADDAEALLDCALPFSLLVLVTVADGVVDEGFEADDFLPPFVPLAPTDPDAFFSLPACPSLLLSPTFSR
jgi:hypothetical protein